MTNFSERLKVLRATNKVTQKAIAEYLEITSNSYQNYEYGKREPDFNTLIKIADFFNISTDYLLGRTDNPEINK